MPVIFYRGVYSCYQSLPSPGFHGSATEGFVFSSSNLKTFMEGLKHYFLSLVLTWETFFIPKYDNVSDLCKVFTNSDFSVLRDGGGGVQYEMENQLLLTVLPFTETANMAREVFDSKTNELSRILVAAANLYKTPSLREAAVSVINQVTEHGYQTHPFAGGKIESFLELTGTDDRDVAMETLAKHNNNVTAAVGAYHDGNSGSTTSKIHPHESTVFHYVFLNPDLSCEHHFLSTCVSAPVFTSEGSEKDSPAVDEVQHNNENNLSESMQHQYVLHPHSKIQRDEDGKLLIPHEVSANELAITQSVAINQGEEINRNFQNNLLDDTENIHPRNYASMGDHVLKEKVRQKLKESGKYGTEEFQDALDEARETRSQNQLPPFESHEDDYEYEDDDVEKVQKIERFLSATSTENENVAKVFLENHNYNIQEAVIDYTSSPEERLQGSQVSDLEFADKQPKEHGSESNMTTRTTTTSKIHSHKLFDCFS